MKLSRSLICHDFFFSMHKVLLINSRLLLHNKHNDKSLKLCHRLRVFFPHCLRFKRQIRFCDCNKTAVSKQTRTHSNATHASLIFVSHLERNKIFSPSFLTLELKVRDKQQLNSKIVMRVKMDHLHLMTFFFNLSCKHFSLLVVVNIANKSGNAFEV